MSRFILLLSLLLFTPRLFAQLITTSPAAPVTNQAVTITFDATEGTGGLANCNCDVYLHTGVITENSSNSSDWKYVQTEWGVANDAWRMTPVEGEPNKYTYTFGPSIREYYGVPSSEVIEQISLVFRNGNGTQEGKAAGGSDIFVDVSEAGSALAITLAGDPGQSTWPLGRPLPLVLGATESATLEIFDNDALVASTTGTELAQDLVFTIPGPHEIRAVATLGQQVVTETFTIDAELVLEITSPEANIIFADPEEQINLQATTYVESMISVNGADPVLASSIDETITAGDVAGATNIEIVATYQSETARGQFTIVVGDPAVENPPADLLPGANVGEDGSVTLQLRAPGKEDVFVVGNFNNWSPNAESRMKKSVDGGTFWLTLSDLPEGVDLLYQYLVDGTILQADPYSTLILDPNNDPFIGEETFAGIPDYPTGQTEGLVTWYRLNPPVYDWQVDDYDRPDPKKMVVYELLVRDFIEDHSFKTLTDTLDYLEKLGVNAIELMPVNEFEGNISWGYNPSFHMALDKYYGSPEDFKAFVDACHARGMAVIVDIVYNHAFGQSPLARLWWNEASFRPTPDNPYLNITPRHPFNVGYDFNHESALTKEFVKVTTQYWLEEFRIDGFRWDLSKGFTQNFSGDVGTWNQYDASRIAILKDYADHVWSVDEEAYMIMEHLGVSEEEDELAQYGNSMYFWSGFNPHDQYLEGAMGFPSNFREVISENRGFSDLNLVGYMESHDEERMQFKNEEFGNRSPNFRYDVRNQGTGLDRIELASAFFYTVPGPKMLWQFGELGYDFSINQCPGGGINEGCRTDPKPIRWDYRFDGDRQDVYHTISDILYLRNNYEFFHGEITKQRLATVDKILHLSSSDGNVAIVGNFGVVQQRTGGVWPSAGEWYDYLSGETIMVTDPNVAVDLEPGEFHIYLPRPISRGGGRLVSTNDRNVAQLKFSVSPNPTTGQIFTNFSLDRASEVVIDLMDVSGRQMQRLFRGRLTAGDQRMDFQLGQHPAGIYFLRVTEGQKTAVRRIVIN
jgi:hypothetical protein